MYYEAPALYRHADRDFAAVEFRDPAGAEHPYHGSVEFHDRYSSPLILKPDVPPIITTFAGSAGAIFTRENFINSTAPFDTIILSDVHIGTNSSREKFLLAMLELLRPRQAVYDGDLVDISELGVEKGLEALQAFKERSSEFVQISRHLGGNHDIYMRDNPHLFKPVPDKYNFITLPDKALLQMPDGRHMLIVHGDIFDRSVDNEEKVHRWMKRGKKLNKFDENLTAAARRLGLPSLSPSHTIRQIWEGGKPSRRVRNGALSNVMAYNENVFRWNLQNPQDQLPMAELIGVGHVHRAHMWSVPTLPDMETGRILGPETVTYLNFGMWVGSPVMNMFGDYWQNRQKWPECVFYGIRTDGTHGMCAFQPVEGLALLDQQSKKGHYRNPFAMTARDRIMINAKPYNSRLVA